MIKYLKIAVATVSLLFMVVVLVFVAPVKALALLYWIIKRAVEITSGLFNILGN
jgi:membrane protein YdbS with pleckstrin-like domain